MAQPMNWVRKMSVVNIRDMAHARTDVPKIITPARPVALPATELTSRKVAQAALKPASASGRRTAHSLTPKTDNEAATAQ